MISMTMYRLRQSLLSKPYPNLDKNGCRQARGLFLSILELWSLYYRVRF